MHITQTFKNQQPERHLQKAICKYLNIQYPNIYFDSDSSGIKVSWNTALLLQQTRSNRHAHLDLFIAEPSKDKKGLFIEIKSETPFKQNGELKTDKHLHDQFKTMEMLRSKGYHAVFVWTFEQAKEVLDFYLGAPPAISDKHILDDDNDGIK